MDDSTKSKAIAVGVVLAIVVLSLIVPMDHWSGSITSGRYVSEGVIVDRDAKANTITVRLYSMSEGKGKGETSTFVQLEGEIPQDSHLGQNVRIGYSKKGLYEDPSQDVEVSFFTSGNLMTGLILPCVIPHRAYNDCAIIGVESDGSMLTYNVAT